MDTFNLLSSLMVLFIGISRCDEMLGPGKWSVLNIERCEEDDMFTTKMDASSRRVNRTHIAFTFKGHYDRDVDENVAIRIDICKYVDGGCKPYHVLADKSAINFFDQYGKKNIAAALNMSKLYNWPIPKGDYTVEDFIFNMDEAPKTSLYGEFKAKGYLLTNGAKFGCIQVAVTFEKSDEEDEDD